MRFEDLLSEKATKASQVQIGRTDGVTILLPTLFEVRITAFLFGLFSIYIKPHIYTHKDIFKTNQYIQNQNLINRICAA